MPTEYHHGARTQEVSGAALSVTTVSTAIIGLVATGADADDTIFPLNTAVLLTNAKSQIGKAGTQGTLAQSLLHITNLVSCPIIVVRVEEGADEAQTSVNVIGNVTATGAYTGMQALLTAEARTGVRPRIIGCPGLDTEEVTTAMAIVAKNLRAYSYASCSGAATVSDCLAYREQFSARELTLIWPDFSYFDTVGAKTATALTVAVAMGLRAQIDQKVGWHKTLSNVPVDGVTGITKDVYFAFQQVGTDADLLNAKGITTLINRQGFRFWGNRTCDDAEFIFESYTRTAQVLADSMAEAMFPYIDKPMSPVLIKDIIDGFNAKGAQYVRDGMLIGFKAFWNPDLNTTDELKNGRGVISYKYTPVPPFEDVTLQQEFTDEFFVNLSSAIATQIGS
ncbi:phage tail sheath subtilisin-like domain-containing protein [Luteibacter sp. NPDC031894]|uniref:phage tail sheath subtilisin-like domain-containing protein n=1 Tax=Luteibacter sp. NPDC031894 TaxID=3390572 RepID=UPI003D06175D